MKSQQIRLTATDGERFNGAVAVNHHDKSRVFIRTKPFMSLSRDEAITFATAIVNTIDQLEGATHA